MRTNTIHRHTGTDKCADTCTDMRIDMCTDICADMRIDMCTGMRIHKRTDMCIDMCAGMRIDMCTGMRADICRHGYRHALACVRACV